MKKFHRNDTKGMQIFPLCCARFSWKLSVKVVFIFSSKTSVLVWCGLKQAENEPKTTHVLDPRLSLCENERFQKRAYSACFQAEYDLYINSGTAEEILMIFRENPSQNHNLRRESLLQNCYNLRTHGLKSQSPCGTNVWGTNPSVELMFVARSPLRNYYSWYESLCGIIIYGMNPLRNYYCGTNPSA